MSVRIRQAEPIDARAIAECHVRSWQRAYRGQIPDEYLDETLPSEIAVRTARWERGIRERGRRHQLIALEGDRVAGFAVFGPCEDEDAEGRGEVYAIYLDPDRWGQGYGRALITAAEHGLRDDGYTVATLWVLETNDRARRFYELAGWSPDGGRKTEPRSGFELREVRYRRDLTARM